MNYGAMRARINNTYAKYAVRLQKIRDRLRFNGHHPELRACTVRSVINEPFNKARINEAIVTFRFGNPCLIDIDDLEEITRNLCSSHKASYVFKRIKERSETYMEFRSAVQHWVWK